VQAVETGSSAPLVQRQVDLFVVVGINASGAHVRSRRSYISSR